MVVTLLVMLLIALFFGGTYSLAAMLNTAQHRYGILAIGCMTGMLFTLIYINVLLGELK